MRSPSAKSIQHIHPLFHFFSTSYEINVKKIAFGNKEHTKIRKLESRIYWDSS